MVAIKDMEMPGRCDKCFFKGYSECLLTKTFIIDEARRAENCPLVEVEERKVVKCTDCKEYNQDKHYCPKFCDVIRDTTKELQEFYKGEHEKLEKIEQIMNKESEGYIQNNPCLRERLERC